MKIHLLSKEEINKLILGEKFCNASHVASFFKVIKVHTK